MSNFKTNFINHMFPECSIRLHLASCVPSYGMGIEASSEDSGALSNDSLAVQLSSQYLSRLLISLTGYIDDPGYLLPSRPDISSNDNGVSTCA